MADQEARSELPDVVGSAGERVEGMIDRLFEKCDASSVFGPPTQSGEKVFITASTTQKAGGFGFGGGGGADEKNFSVGFGGGGGGGGKAEGRAIAVIEISPDGVEIKPVFDFTRIAVTIILAAVSIWRAARH